MLNGLDFFIRKNFVLHLTFQKMIDYKTPTLDLKQFQNLKQFEKDICHFVTTRHGGISHGTYNSLNLGMVQDDDTDNVIENRNRVAKAVGLELKDFVYPIQVHGVNVPRIYEDDRGKGTLSLNDAFANTDGFITNTPRLCLMTLAADCVPIIFFDPVAKAIGVAHAGWKGTVNQIPKYLINRMEQEFNTNPKDLIVGIGPSGGPSRYEVGNDVVEEASKNFRIADVIKNINGTTFFDMWEANRLTLIESSVNPINIETSDICTISHNEEFFSARHGDGGRFAAGIYLK